MSRTPYSGAWRTLAFAAACYSVGFLLFYPEIPTVRDEVNYLEPALAYAHGTRCHEAIDAFDGTVRCIHRSRYLPGTSVLMTPFVAAFGWRGGFLLGLVGLLAGVAATAHWIRLSGRSPAFAMLVLGFPPILVLSRTAMSDVPSMTLAAVGLALFWTGADRGHRGAWFASGFIAGLCAVFRETNVLVFGVFFLGALLRREHGVGALIAGGLAGLVVRPLACALLLGDPLYTFERGVFFGLEHLSTNLPLFALYLLLYVPFGIVGTLAYRGERRPELIATFGIFLAPYLILSYSAAESGPLKQLVLGPRYLLPLLPLVAFACAESLPRLARRMGEGLDASRRSRFETLVRVGILVWTLGVSTAAFLVHPAHAAWARTQVDVRSGIFEHTPEGGVVVINDLALKKFVNFLFGNRIFLERRLLSDEDLDRLLKRHGEFYVALLDRSESESWLRHAGENAAFAERVSDAHSTRLLLDTPAAPGERLRVWRVTPR